MPIRPRRLVLALAALLPALGLGALTGPAHADSAWTSSSIVVGIGSFSRVGVIPGQPGNAHSGLVSFDSSEDPLGVTLYDWRCPAGVQPPTYYPQDTTCTMVRRREGQMTELTGPQLTLTGPLDARSRALTQFDHLVQSVPTGQVDTLPVDVRWQQAGAITRTVTTYHDATVDARTVTVKAPMRLSGHIGWVDLSDPRNHASVDYYLRETDYDHYLSAD